jgi:N-acyl-L-homoserine lactone synthetase
MSVKIILAREAEEKSLAYRLRYKVMCRDLGWLPAQDYPLGEEQDEYDAKQSIAFLALDFIGNCAGTSRLILPGKIALPIENHFEILRKDLLEASYGKMDYCVEVSRFAVPDHPFLKNHEITLKLCRAMIMTSIKMGVTHMLMSIDYRFFRLLKMLGFCLTEIGKPKFYMGSKTIPGVLPLTNLLPVLRNKKPSLYRYLTVDEEVVEETVAV